MSMACCRGKSNRKGGQSVRSALCCWTTLLTFAYFLILLTIKRAKQIESYVGAHQLLPVVHALHGGHSLGAEVVVVGVGRDQQHVCVEDRHNGQPWVLVLVSKATACHVNGGRNPKPTHRGVLVSSETWSGSRCESSALLAAGISLWIFPEDLWCVWQRNVCLSGCMDKNKSCKYFVMSWPLKLTYVDVRGGQLARGSEVDPDKLALCEAMQMTNEAWYVSVAFLIIFRAFFYKYQENFSLHPWPKARTSWCEGKLYNFNVQNALSAGWFLALCTYLYNCIQGVY